VNGDGEMRFRRWRQFGVEALLGVSAAALAFAAIGGTAEPILAAVVLTGIALLMELHFTARPASEIGPLPAWPIVESAEAPPLPQATPGFGAAIVEATSV
jgi:hypothetical protein